MEIKTLTEKINAWVTERGWDKAQTPRSLAISISIEAAEVLEHFQWRNDKKSAKHVKDNKEEVADELADVAIYLFKLADKIGVDLGKAITNKLAKASKKYPAELVQGDSLEYEKIKKAYRNKRRTLI